MTETGKNKIAHLFGRDIELEEVVATGVAIGGFISIFIHGAISMGEMTMIDLFVAAYGPVMVVAVSEHMKG